MRESCHFLVNCFIARVGLKLVAGDTVPALTWASRTQLAELSLLPPGVQAAVAGS